MTPEQRQRVEMADWQKARFGDSDEARAALAYWRERGWHVDDRQKCPDERVYDFMSGWRAAHALTAAALDAAEQERKLLLANERFKDGLIHDQRERAEQAEAQLAALTAPPAPPRKACPYGDPACPCQDGDSCHYEDTVDTQAMAPPAPHAEAVRVLEEAWWRGRLSATARQGEWAGPELRERCGKDIADVLAALRAEGEGGDA